MSAAPFMPLMDAPDAAQPEWRISAAPVDYADALAEMEQRVAGIIAGEARELVWLLEHPPLYTAGTSAAAGDLLAPERFPVYRAGRGGQYTYHGPGQRIAYVMLDLNRRRRDVRLFVRCLEEWLIAALARLGVQGERRDGRIGIWVRRGGGREDKIAAVGIRLRHWVSFHGVSLNIDPQLEHFSGIVPCGVRGHGITSLADLGLNAGTQDVDEALRAAFGQVFPAAQAAAAAAEAETEAATRTRP